jgi:hypothetical protein
LYFVWNRFGAWRTWQPRHRRRKATSLLPKAKCDVDVAVLDVYGTRRATPLTLTSA